MHENTPPETARLIETHQDVWFLAAGLDERLSQFRKLSSKSSAQSDSNYLRAQRILDRWRSQSPLDDETIFSEKLRSYNCTREELLKVLGAEGSTVSVAEGEPCWLTKLQTILESAHEYEESFLPFEKFATERNLESLTAIVYPIITYAIRDLMEHLEGLVETAAIAPININKIKKSMEGKLSKELLWVVAQTSVLEFYLARHKGTLQGLPPEECLSAFIQGLRDTETLTKTLQKYPVLARIVVERSERWLECTKELFERLVADWSQICESIDLPLEAKLVEVRGNLGDRHGGGRSVHKLSFDSGHKLIYKPQKLQAIGGFKSLLKWVNNKDRTPQLKSFSHLENRNYGWAEYVAAKPCHSEEEVESFYTRQGCYIALLHALGATDMHHENLIAHGEYPILIDLETILTPCSPKEDLTPLEIAITRITEGTVLSTGLLPATRHNAKQLEISGLGGHEGQQTSNPIPHIVGIDSDRLRIARDRLPIKSENNLPVLNGNPMNPGDYIEPILEGYESMTRLLIDHRDELLSPAGPLQAFSGITIRVVLRPTRIYGIIRQESYHPYLLGDAIEREMHFDRLWTGTKRREYLRRLVPHEIKELKRDDIPLWTVDCDSRDLDGKDGVDFPSFFEKSALENARFRISNLTESSLMRNRVIIRNSLLMYKMNRGWQGAAEDPYISNDQNLLRLARPEEDLNSGQEPFLQAALMIGEITEEWALRAELDGQKIASWIRARSKKSQLWNLSLMTFDLYDGIPGIVLFLAYLSRISGVDHFRDVARQGLRALEAQLSRIEKAETVPIGAFNGLAGWIYCLSHLSTIWDDSSLMERACELLDPLEKEIKRDQSFDFISGVAGLIPVLLSFYDQSREERALQLARQCGEHLVLNHQRLESGVVWINPDSAERPLAGFGHGGSGIAFALSSLSNTSVWDSTFRDLALDAIRYERSLFDRKVGNWEDLRERPGQEHLTGDAERRFLWAWCHGAPGIGLARLGILRHLEDPVVREDAELAIKSTLRNETGRSQCLCHGDLGNLELLLEAQRQSMSDEFQTEIETRGQSILDDLRERGFSFGTPNGIQNSGLMTGLAGIGFGLLRLARPDAVPAILLLDPCPDLPPESSE